MPQQPTLVRPLLEAAATPEDVQANIAGQAVGLVREILPAARAAAVELALDAAEVIARDLLAMTGKAPRPVKEEDVP